MSAPPRQRLPPGHALFVRYAFPPNELGYCGPADPGSLLRTDDPSEVAAQAREFDGTWPYLRALAGATGGDDPLDVDVVRNYWIGGPLLGRLDEAQLLASLREAFCGQATGLLATLTRPTGVLAHHSFHVMVVYPWVRFLDRHAQTALQVMQNCRIRWGTVESAKGDHVLMSSRPLTFHDGGLGFGQRVVERVRWRRDGVSLIVAPRPGDTVAAHWDWVCDTLTDTERVALSAATHSTINVVNTYRRSRDPQDDPTARLPRPGWSTPSAPPGRGGEKEIS